MNKQLKWILPLLLLIGSVIAAGSAFAEGSKDMMENGGYRSFTQWDTSVSVGNIPMTTKLNVYAKAGETICLGSSVYDRSDNKDIFVYDPSGKEYTFDVKNTSGSNYLGFINTVAKESAGPLPASGGYNPLTVSVAQTGIWRVEFRGPQEARNEAQPTAVLANQQFSTNKNQGMAVAAWDITVRSASGSKIDGRVYTNYLALTVGANVLGSRVVMSDYHVLTKDGYIYKVSFNGADPYRYVFLSNNRGFIDKTNNTTLYHSPSTGAANDNYLDFIKNSGNVAVQMPNVPDTPTDFTHKIFFNYPSSDLPSNMPTTAVAPASVSNFKFVGTSGIEGQMGNDGEGGQFHFDLTAGGSFEIIIDTDKDGKYESKDDRVLSNIGLAGHNTYFWDGKDADGNILTNLSQYNAKIIIRGGEQHFPLLDCEHNAYGIKVQLVNPPSMPSGYNPYTIYYDNSNFTTQKGTYINLDPQGSEVATNPRTALGGVDSTNGALAFNKDYGDKKGMDIWTYFPGDEETCSFSIVSANQIKRGYLSGYVFLDKNTDALFNSGEPGLEGVTVEITDKEGTKYTVKTDISGHYTANILRGAYTVKVIPMPGYTLTTANETQNGVLSSANVDLADVGYYLATDMQIKKTVLPGNYYAGSSLVYQLEVKNAGPAAASGVTVSDPLPAGLEYVSDTSGGAYVPQTGTWLLGDMAVNEVKTIQITAKILSAEEIENTATVESAVNELNTANNTSSVKVTASEAPEISATDDSASTMENSPVMIAVLANDVDPNGDKLTVTGVTQGTNGAVVVNSDGTVTYTPNNGFSGTDVFTYTVADGTGLTTTATVTVVVTPLPRYSIGDKVWLDKNANGIQDTGESGLEGIVVGLYDANSTLCGIAYTDANGIYSLGSVLAGSYFVQFNLPSSNLRFTVKAAGTPQTDSDADIATGKTALFNVAGNITDIDAGMVELHPPVATDDSSSTDINKPVDISVLGNDTDEDGDTLTVTSVTQGTNGTVTINPDGTVTYTPNKDFIGTDTFTYTISDGNRGTDTATVTVTVVDNNHPPVATDDSSSTDINKPVDISVLGNDTDEDGDTLTVTSVTQGTNGTVTVNPDGTVTYTPNKDFIGTDTFTYTISDGNRGTDTATVTVLVTPLPRYSIGDKVWLDKNANGIQDAGESGLEGIVVGLYYANSTLCGIASTDANGIYSFDSVLAGSYFVQFNLLDPNLRFTAKGTGTSQTDSDADIATGKTDLFNVAGNITDIDAGVIEVHPPVATDDSSSTEINKPVNISVLGNDTDEDGDTLTVTGVTQGSNGSVVINPDGTVTYTPNSGFTGTDTFTYTISDGDGGTDTATVTVTVVDNNHPPVAVDDSSSTPKNTSVNIDVLDNDSDQDGDTLTVTGVTQGSNGTVTINSDGTVTYTPNSGFTGTDTFTYTISDGNSGTDTATVTVTVADNNHPPVANNDSSTTSVNTPVNIDILDNDSDQDGDTLTVTSVTQGSNGTVTINSDGTVTYTPNSGFTGTDTFTYTISDGNGGTDTATVTVTIPSSEDDYTCDEGLGDPSDPKFAAYTYRIAGFAGTGTGGFNGERGTSSPRSYTPATGGEVYGPRGLAVDLNGNVYIADEMNGSVRKVSGGTMTTIAGNGIENGYTPSDYTGAAYGKGMYEPMDVIIAPCGKYVFFLDTDHHIIRMIDQNGNLKTVAGVLEIGSAGGYASGNGDPLKAKFKTPQGIAIDKSGNLYVADTGNHIIRKISLKNHTITTIAGQPGIGGYSGDGGQAKDATLRQPMGLAFDSKGDLYFADVFNHVVRKIDMSTGKISTVAGSGKLPTNSATAEGVGDNGDALDARLLYPHDIAIDAADNLYIADSGNHRIRKVFADTNEIITIAGDGILGASTASSDATSVHLNWPKGVVVDAKGVVYISDTLNHVVRKLIP